MHKGITPVTFCSQGPWYPGKPSELPQVINLSNDFHLMGVSHYPMDRSYLVGGWTNHLEKYARQNGFIFPRDRGEKKKMFELKPPASNPCTKPFILTSWNIPFVPTHQQRQSYYLWRMTRNRREKIYLPQSLMISCVKPPRLQKWQKYPKERQKSHFYLCIYYVHKYIHK